MSERGMRWQKVGVIAAVVSIMCVVVVSFLTSVVGSTFKQQLDHDREVAAAQHTMQLDADYATCQKANDTRSALRANVNSRMEIVFHIAPPQPLDPAVLNDPQLRTLAELKQAADRTFREDQQAQADHELSKLQPRDCDAERKAAGG
jgi:hypothetical protein